MQTIKKITSNFQQFQNQHFPFIALHCRVIRLPNGLTACLVSDPSNNFANGLLEHDEEDETEDEYETEEETGSDASENEISDDDVGDARRTLKSFETEEKLVKCAIQRVEFIF